MSPQSRRGKAVPQSHRKSSSSNKAPATRQTAAAAAPVESVESGAEERFEEAAPIQPKRAAKPIRRKRGLSGARHSSAAKYGSEWLRAYAPLFAVAVVAFFALWAWVSFGPHTPTPAQNWTSIETAWKPKVDADLKKVSTAVAADSFQGQLKAYEALSVDMKGWMGALGAVTNWEDPNATPNLSQTTTATDAMSALTADGLTELVLLDTMSKAKTPNDILASKDELLADQQTFLSDYHAARVAIFGTVPASVPEPSVAFPPGTYVPTPSPVPSGSAGPSTSPGASASASTAPTASPSPSPSPAPSTSPAPS